MNLTIGGFASLLLLPLLLHLPTAAMAAVPPNGSLTYPLVLPSGYYEYFPIQAFATATVVQYSSVSNVSVSTDFMTAAQLQDFNSSNGPVSNSVAHANGTDVSNAVSVGPGSYDVLVYAYGGTANVTVAIAIHPNNPFAFGPPTTPEPSGIVSFGLTNESGTDNAYAIASTDVVGLASIEGLTALNSSADSVGVHPTGATLQLNSMLVVEEGAAGSQVYWCQNTPDFVTSTSQVSLSDNVWNASASGVLTNDSISSQGGGGTVSTLQENGSTLYYYAIERSNSTYSLPLGVVLLMNATAEPGTGVLVQFGAAMAGGSLGIQGTEWFDNVTIHNPEARSAYFSTDGNYSTPGGMFYDTELVFGGEGNGEETYFTNMTASLGLYYANGTSPWLSPFPSYFSFGLDTKEAADNLRMSYLGNGQAMVTTGAHNYGYLGPASGAFSVAQVESALGFPSLVVTSTTSAPTTTTTPAGTAAQTSTSGSGVPEFPAGDLAVAALVTLLAVSYMAVRRRALRDRLGTAQG